jgi:hypothetical protein
MFFKENPKSLSVFFCMNGEAVEIIEERSMTSKTMETNRFFNGIPLTKTFTILIHKDISINIKKEEKRFVLSG